MATLVLVEPLAAAADAPTSAGCVQASARPFADQRPLELRQRAENVEHELTGAGVGVDRLLQAAQPDALRAQRLGVRDEVLERPAQPVEPPHHQRVAGTELGERLAQGGALGRAARRVLEDALAPGRLQRLPLQVELLVLGLDARVADQHWLFSIVIKSCQRRRQSTPATGIQSEPILVCPQAPHQKKTFIKQLIRSHFARARDSRRPSGPHQRGTQYDVGTGRGRRH